MIQIDQYTAVEIDEYKGVYSITEGWEGQDGTFKKRWVKEEIGKDKAEKNRPKSVKLGDKKRAVDVLRILADSIESGTDVPF
jgi:hypothetical protein